jgi:hypothetical protein
MTLCIAATCFDPGPLPQKEIESGRIRLSTNMAVVSWDMRQTNTVSAADIGRKIVALTSGWCCLLAGALGEADALARICGREFTRSDDGPLNELNLTARISAGVRWYAAEKYLAKTYGIHVPIGSVPLRGFGRSDTSEIIRETLNIFGVDVAEQVTERLLEPRPLLGSGVEREMGDTGADR